MEVTKIINTYSIDCDHVLNIHKVNTPIGDVYSAADDLYLYMVCFEDTKRMEKMIKTISKELACKFVQGKNKIIEKFEDELSSYFDGSLRKFTVPIKTIGSEFQKEVWNKMLDMPYGSTQTYSDLARALSRSASHSRAIGAACGANAHVLIIPCHRVVATGSKGGFSCGVNKKEWLLEHENKHSSCC